MKNLTRMLCAALLLLASCKPEPPGLPDPPAGGYAFGGEFNDMANDVLQLPDGNFLLLGGTANDVANYDLYLVKVSPQGELLSSRVWEDELVTVGQRMVLAADGNVILTAYSMEGQYDPFDILVKKVDTELNSIWENSFAQEDVYRNFTRMNQFFRNGSGYLITTTVGQSPMLLQIGEDGSEKWRRYYPNEYAPAYGSYACMLPNQQIVMATFPYEYYYAGETNLTFLDSLGNTLTAYTYSNPSFTTPPNAVVARPDNGFYVIASPVYQNFGVLSRFDSAGTLTAVNTYEQQTQLGAIDGYLNDAEQIGLSMGILESYYYEAYNGYSGMGKLVLDSSGTVIASDLYAEYKFQRAGGMCPTADGRYAICGNTLSFGSGGLDYLFTIQD